MELDTMTMPVVRRADGAIGPVPGVCYAVVRQVHNSDPAAGYPPNVNRAAAFTYDMDVQGPFGAVRGVTNCTVAVPRWPTMVTAFTVGQTLLGLSINGQFWIMTAEMPFFAPCDWTPSTTPPSTPPGPNIDAPGPVKVLPPPMLDPEPPYPGANP